MAEIYFEHTTRKGKSGHRHLVYFSANGSPEVGEAKGHYHAVEQKIMLDEMGNPIPAGWQILEASGHTHDFSGALDMPDDKPARGDEAEEVKKLRNLFKAAKEYEHESRKNAEESMDFYMGKQWRSQDRRSLEDNKRTVLTINHIAPAIDTLSGYFRQNRTSYKLYPVENSDSLTADVFTEVLRNICEQNGMDTDETLVFEDQTICGRGLFHSYVSYDDNVRGDIKIERYEWDEVWFGPHNKVDGSDSEHLHKGKWYSKDKLKQLYPEKADQIQRDYSLYESQPDPHKRYEGRQYRESEMNEETSILDSEFVNTKNKEYFLVETEQKEYTNVPILVHFESEDTYNADGWRDEDIAGAKSIGFAVIERPVHKMRVTKFAGSVLLEDDVLDETEFTITPVYAKKRKGTWFGKVELAKDPQRELNKHRSHGVDIINKAYANGWFYDERTFATKADEDTFTRRVTTPGFKAKVTDAARPPVRAESDPVPSAIIQMQETARGEVREILNVRPEVLDSKSSSGLALIEGKKSVLVGNEFLYDNMAQSKKRLGKRIIKLVQQTYTPERIIRILGTMAQRRPVELAGQPFNPQDQQQAHMVYQAIVNALENDELTRLDLVVGESSHSPNKQLADFTMMLEIGRVTGGQAVPPDILIETSPLAEDVKQKILQAIAQQRQAQAQAEQSKQAAEMQKSLPDEIKMMQAMQQQAQQRPPQGIPPQGPRRM